MTGQNALRWKYASGQKLGHRLKNGAQARVRARETAQIRALKSGGGFHVYNLYSVHTIQATIRQTFNVDRDTVGNLPSCHWQSGKIITALTSSRRILNRL